ncbi:MAG: sulfotransferase family protein [Gammaproteobacteria bacterium]
MSDPGTVAVARLALGDHVIDQTNSSNNPTRTALFVVGMPRSGTKLLRSLLNRHSALHIPDYESRFIPKMARRYAGIADLREHGAFDQLAASIAKTNFWHNLVTRDGSIDESRWRSRIQRWDFEGVIRALYEQLAENAGKRIWGDKTPQYLTELPTIAQHFPYARFVHIVRDARDVCLSSRQAWGKCLLRNAQRWNDDVARCRADGKRLEGRYLELRYESLIQQPRIELERICEFLAIPFEADMLTLLRSPEELGDTKGVSSIVSTNSGKWRDKLSAQQLQAMENVAGQVLHECGYETTFRDRARRVPQWKMSLMRALDAVNFARVSFRNTPNVKRALRILRTSTTYRSSA